MLRETLVALVLLSGSVGVAFAAAPRGYEMYQKCPDQEQLAAEHVRTSVGLLIPLKEDEQPNAYTNAIGGTAWFRGDNHTIVTIEHVVTAAHLSVTEWRPVTLFWFDEEGKEELGDRHSIETQAKIGDVFVGDSGAEVLVALELKDPVPGAKIAKLRSAPLQQNEPVFAIAYPVRTNEMGRMLAVAQPKPYQVLSFAYGNVRYPTPSGDESMGDEQEPPLYIPLDVGDKDGHRDVLIGGASGSPVFDCDGMLAATNVVYKSRPMSFGPLGTVTVPPPWGMANGYAVSVSSDVSRKRDAVANLMLPTHDAPAVSGGVSPDDELTARMNALVEAAKRTIETGGNAEELQRAWEALQESSKRMSGDAPEGEVAPPAMESPFQ